MPSSIDEHAKCGMLLAAQTYLLTRGQGTVLCCKLHHENNSRCIFRCRYHECADHSATRV
jgi:hypothetical protein